MKIDLVSFNGFLKIFCHLTRQIDLPQFPSDIRPCSPCASTINRETNREIPRITPAQNHFQNHLQSHLQKHAQDLISWSVGLIKKFFYVAVDLFLCDAQSLRAENALMIGDHS
jgi:hypothetical protein